MLEGKWAKILQSGEYHGPEEKKNYKYIHKKLILIEREKTCIFFFFFFFFYRIQNYGIRFPGPTTYPSIYIFLRDNAWQRRKQIKFYLFIYLFKNFLGLYLFIYYRSSWGGKIGRFHAIRRKLS